ncbi:uncharacterized protein LOC131143469 [Malania oleifera]|uniref:uncharacterized protein LOC131143469 n=1 Tax=Malania oleifera TaxID=397392 RepID=UPI0025AE74D4|nr:uncharacterized protein LOC131143469 [Malania oleifera]
MVVSKMLQDAEVMLVNHNVQHDNGTSSELNLQVAVHYGIPATASILAFDPIQGLLAIGTLDGRIKVIGGDNIEGLLKSEKKVPYKFLEFLENKGALVGISNDNDIQVWNLEGRCTACCLQWQSNITSFSLISGSLFMYIGDEYGLLSVLKYEAEGEKLLRLPYHISANSISEAAGFSFPNYQPIVGVLPQPCSFGNRVLIAYENGLLILWDILEAQIVVVKGDKDLQLKDGVVFTSEVDASVPDGTAEHNIEEKEISALCWASSDGSILAVGYVDGDILFWNLVHAGSSKDQHAGLSCNVVKLQLSSAERRLPVIVLHWSKNIQPCNDHDGQLFIYGGDEIGSEEVLTVLNLEWSSGSEILRCVGRVNLTLAGSFADMILLQGVGATGSSHNVALFLLTNPGQLHFYDDASLSALMSQQERKPISAVEFPLVIPTADPCMTVTKLSLLPADGNSSKALSQMVSVVKLGTKPDTAGGMEWPLTGGVCTRPVAESNRIERVFLAGYQDGSVLIWDATFPVLLPICVLKGKVPGIEAASSSAPVSKLDFCCISLSLAVGNESGLVLVYGFNGSLEETNVHFVTENKHEVHHSPQEEVFHCRAVFHLLNSPVHSLSFANSGAKLAVGYGCGRVVVLNMSSFSVLYSIDSVSGSSSPVLSMTWKTFKNSHIIVKGSMSSGSDISGNPVEELMFILTKDANVTIVDVGTGKMISCWSSRLKRKSAAISMHVIEGSAPLFGLFSGKQPEQSSKDNVAKSEHSQENNQFGMKSHKSEPYSSSEAGYLGEILLDSFVLLCFEDSFHVYHTKSAIQGQSKPVHKLKLAKACCWTSTFKKDEKDWGLVLLYQNGDIEIRSLPRFELVRESSLMSILRWNFKANMDKTISSDDNGQIMLVNGCEVALISLLAGGNDSRIMESLPCLHDKVVAAAADAAISVSVNQKKKQGAPGILDGIVKGIKGRKVIHTADLTTTSNSCFTHLDGIFSTTPFSDLPESSTSIQETTDLNIDDIEIDEPTSTASTSCLSVKDNKREKGSERERLFQGGSAESADTKPRLRTPEEIIATYRKAGDASSVAAHARDKLAQRQEKLERISRRTEELKSGAEDFASLANELVKTMEGRKWWKI